MREVDRFVGETVVQEDDALRGAGAGGTARVGGGGGRATQAQRRLHETLAGDSRVSATTIQTVGAKGYDGFLIALVEGA